jgi:hypothetical protein
MLSYTGIRYVRTSREKLECSGFSRSHATWSRSFDGHSQNPGESSKKTAASLSSEENLATALRRTKDIAAPSCNTTLRLILYVVQPCR